MADLRIRPDFPHALRIEVIEHQPVALVQLGAHARCRRPAAGCCSTACAPTTCPVIRANEPPLRRPRAGRRASLAALGVAAAAPPALAQRSERLFFGAGGHPRSICASGPELLFGAADAARDKWKAAARVLAEDSSAGATYLDLRVPELVAAGGVGPGRARAGAHAGARAAATAGLPSEPSTVG